MFAAATSRPRIGRFQKDLPAREFRITARTDRYGSLTAVKRVRPAQIASIPALTVSGL